MNDHFITSNCHDKENTIKYLLLCTIKPEKTANIWDATTCISAKRGLRKECRNSILMMSHYPELGTASDWMKQISLAAQLIRSTTLIWVVMEFLCTFTSCHFAGKAVVTLQTFSCFLRLSTT